MTGRSKIKISFRGFRVNSRFGVQAERQADGYQAVCSRRSSTKDFSTNMWRHSAICSICTMLQIATLSC